MGRGLKIGQKISIKKLISWTGCSVLSYGAAADGQNAYISSISTDTRKIKENDFFIPVLGQNYDGHDFLAEAVKKKCAGFVIDSRHSGSADSARLGTDPKLWERLIILQAEDTITFLLDVAHNYIRKFNPLVIGVTGSAGKTTTKDFIVEILSGAFNTGFTPGNFNTELGIALAVLEITKDTQFFVAELGMRASGQIEMLSKVINIDIGAITSVGESHLEFFNNVEDIALAKAEIAVSLEKKGGVLFLNNDNDYAQMILENVRCRIIKYGMNNNLEFNFIGKGADRAGCYSMELFSGKNKINEFMVPVAGYHNLYNACCAAAICSYLGVDKELIKNGIEGAAAGENRMEIFEKSGKMIINDCYNASPISMKCAIDTLKTVSDENKCRSVAVLADMLELGKQSQSLHFEIGRYLKKKEIEVLIAIGEISSNICNGYAEGSGISGPDNIDSGESRKVYFFKDTESFIKNAEEILKPGDCILIKGSRANKLEKLIDFI